MNDDSPTRTGGLGQQPKPRIGPGEPNPGGVDALPDEVDNISADLDPAKNPAVDESPDPLKEAFSEREDTETEATRAEDGDEDVPPEEESPALRPAAVGDVRAEAVGARRSDGARAGVGHAARQAMQR